MWYYVHLLCRQAAGLVYLCTQQSRSPTNSLVILRLYCPIGSEIAPETAGPMIKPNPHEVEIIDAPRAWVESSEISEITAQAAPTTPGENESTDGSTKYDINQNSGDGRNFQILT